ncbi:MAG: alpha/beta hydrolase [Burkholderiales bacterium]|nr:alpha/beta hydrolase [Burkholderiales bacterium]
MAQAAEAAPAQPGQNAAMQMFQQWIQAMRDAAGLQCREVTLDDGLRYVYLEAGQGEPLLLLHGFGSNKDHFVRVAKSLAQRWRVIVPDHIGFGESDHPAEADYTPSAQAERLHRLAAALGLGPVHLGGSSMGGHIAMTWAALYPAEVKSLWLLNPGGAWSAPASELRTRIEQEGRNVLIADTVDEFRELLATVVHRPVPVPEPLLQAMAAERLANADLERRIFEHCAAEAVEPRIGGLATPALIVWGAHDRIIHPGSAAVLQGLMANARVQMMDDVGHLPAMEQPERVVADYLAFRDGV